VFRVRRQVLLVITLFSSLGLIACGNSNGMHGSPAPPVFTSTPGTAASQGNAYSYQITATDPSGGTVSFSLTTSPTGAALSGNSLAWTPAASESRLSNSFTVTATTSEGGTATQSWSVSPTGTVTVNWVNTNWESTGPVHVPVSPSASLNVSAVVPQPDGSLTVLNGTNSAPGVVTISGVPAGYYWLTFTPALSAIAPLAYWTSTSTFDAGRDFAGSPVSLLSTPEPTNLDFGLSGLDSVASATSVSFSPAMQLQLPYFGDPADSTTLTVSLNENSNIDWSQVKSGFLLQYEPSTLGPLNNLVLGPAAELSGLSLANGTTNTITQSLQPSPQASLGINVLGSQWANLFTNASPSAPTSYSSGISLIAEPFVTGTDATGLDDLTLAGTSLQISGNGFAFQPFGGCDALGFPLIGTNTQPAILTDQNLGTLQYGDPFSSSWARVFSFCEEAVVPIPLPNSSATMDFALVAGVRTAPSNSPIGPLVGPVQSATIGGGSLFTAATLTTASPTLNWSAPTGTNLIGYTVGVFVAVTQTDGTVAYARAGTFSTAKTSITLVPLSGGNTYVFSITALVNAAANIETSPHRSALPTAFASVVSAPITILSGASAPAIRGDAKVVRRLSQPVERDGTKGRAGTR
jgi:hypothetical protein